MIGGTAASTDAPADGQAVLAAIGRARRWVDEIMTGATVTEIARREGKGERQIRLLMPPETVRGLIDGRARSASVTEIAKGVPLVWTP
jgi:hypothetical protein